MSDVTLLNTVVSIRLRLVYCIVRREKLFITSNLRLCTTTNNDKNDNALKCLSYVKVVGLILTNPTPNKRLL